jgi:hypothetical protein
LKTHSLCFKSIPFSQAIRIKRICSTVETTKQRIGDLRHHLKRREYNDKVIKEKKINKRVPLVLTYHPSLEKISGIVRHHWKEIEKSETVAKLFPDQPVVAFRRPKSIKCCLHSKTTGKKNKIFCNVNCKTPNVVYLLDCHVCGSQYVGESVQPFQLS